MASKPSRVTRIKLLKSLRRTLFGPNAEVKRAPNRLAKKRKAKSVKEEDSDGVPPRPKAKAKAKVKSKAMPRPRGTVRGFFDARRGRRVEVPLRGPNEAPKPRMIRAFSGFSFRPVNHLKRRICGNYGHVAASCIQGERSVSLTTGKIQLSQRIDPKSDEDLRGDALPNYGLENPLSSQISPGDSVSQVGYSPVAPKYALPIPTAPGMSADERLRLLLKKRKSEEPQRRHQGYETSDEVWPRDDGEETGDLKEELRRKRKRMEMKPFNKENRERPSYMRPLPEDPRKKRPKHSEAAPPKRPPVAPPKTPPKGPMPPPPKKKAMPTAPKTPPKKPAVKAKTPAKDVSKASSSSEAPRAPEHVPKAIGIGPPKTPPKMAPKTPSAAGRSVSPTLVDAAATPAEPKSSGVDRTKDSSPTKHPEGLPEQSVEECVTPEATPKPPPPPLDSPPTAHQEPPPPPTEIGFPVTGPAEVPKSPMVAPVLPKSLPARPLIDWGAPASAESPIGSTSDITRIMGLGPNTLRHQWAMLAVQ